jgi:bcr-type benzoyl-CoA reductase subunit C
MLKQFEEIATSPKEQFDKFLLEGKKVVLCAPVYTPNEIIHSMGLIPFGTWGADMGISNAKQYYPAFICSIIQSILELGMKGSFDGASAIVIPSLCDSLKSLGENWKYAVDKIPFIPMVYPQNRKEDFGIDFTVSRYKRVIEDLERITNVQFCESSLISSLEMYNRHNKVMREFSDAVSRYSSITAEERSYVFKSSYFMDVEEHTSMVEELIELINEAPTVLDSKTRIILTGILADNANLLGIMDENKFHIVSDDLAHESRQYRVDSETEGNALLNLASKFARMDNCSVLFDPKKGRADYLLDQVKTNDANGVIFCMTKFCDPEEFDIVIIKNTLDNAGIPNVTIEIDRQMENYEQARTILQTFKEVLG